jgi:hypothetical protein
MLLIDGCFRIQTKDTGHNWPRLFGLFQP